MIPTHEQLRLLLCRTDISIDNWKTHNDNPLSPNYKKEERVILKESKKYDTIIELLKEGKLWN